MEFKRISIESGKLGGAPCIRGQRIQVAVVVGMVAEGMSFEEILGYYPTLEREDIVEALRFAAASVTCP